MSPEREAPNTILLAVVRRGLFWPLVAVASLLEAGAAGSFAAAAFSEPTPRRIADFAHSRPDIFGRVLSLDWSSDRGLLLAAMICFVLGLGTFGLAARAR